MPFDAIEKDDIYVEYFGKKKFADYMYRYVRNALKKIHKDRHLEYKMTNIEQLPDKDFLPGKWEFDCAKPNHKAELVLHPISNNTLQFLVILLYFIKTVLEDADMPRYIVTLTNDEIQELKALVQKKGRLSEN